MKRIFIITAMLACASSVQASENFSYEQQAPVNKPSFYSTEGSYTVKNNTLKGSVVTVPAGQTFKAVMASPISSESAIIGQNITMVLGSDFTYRGEKIAPAGSTISGSVIEVSKAKHGSLNGKMTLRFTQIMTPTGLSVPVSAIIKTDDNTGTLIGGTTLDVAKEYTKDIAVGAGAGALGGVILSPLSGGDVGRGTVLATAVGTGGGLVKSIWDKGADVEIPANALVELILTQPITVNPENKSFGQ